MDNTNNTRLSEVLSRKKTFERADKEKLFFDKVSQQELRVDQITESTRFTDYQNDYAKRRAQTVSVATNIGVKLALSLALTGTVDRYLDATLVNDENFRRRLKLDLANLDPLAGEFIFSEIQKAITEAFALDGHSVAFNSSINTDETLLKIADVSVTLAWYEVWCKTGFMPKELQVVNRDSETHQVLRHEVYIILNKAVKELLQHCKFLNSDVEFDKEVTNDYFNIVGTASIRVDNKILEIKTTGKKPTDSTLLKDAEHGIGLFEIDKTIDTLYLYYARYNLLYIITKA